MIDLHVHSSASDGTLTPSELVALAKETGLAAMALTDHDTLNGVAEALHAGAALGMDVIPGIEMSCVWRGTEIHILGYFPDPEDPGTRDDLSFFIRKREERNDTILDNLAEDGIFLTREELCSGDPDTVITRAHFARLLTEKGYTVSLKEAFGTYLLYGGRYVPTKDDITPEMVMDFFRRHRIWPSLAHPGQYHLTEEILGELLGELIGKGLRGLEVWHSSQDAYYSQRLLTLTRILQLLPTGGSDFHGSNKPDIRLGSGRGSLNVKDRVLADIRKDYAAVWTDASAEN